MPIAASRTRLVIESLLRARSIKPGRGRGGHSERHRILRGFGKRVACVAFDRRGALDMGVYEFGNLRFPANVLIFRATMTRFGELNIVVGELRRTPSGAARVPGVARPVRVLVSLEFTSLTRVCRLSIVPILINS